MVIPRSVVLSLPWPPTVNTYWRRWRNRTLLSRQGREYRRRAKAILLRANVETFTGPVGLDIRLFPPDRRRRDIDNVLKALLDVLTHGRVYEDDSQVVDLHVEKCAPDGRSEAVVTVREVVDV